MRRKICVITGSRAEYSFLKPLLQEFKRVASADLQLIVTGMHLSSEFGLTHRIIQQDGFSIDEKVEMLVGPDTPIGISKSMGLAIRGLSESYARLRPDVVVVLGDRFEIFSAVVAALVNRIPVAHISGGELTQGVIDDSFRHSMTKMSHLHFTSIEEYRKRVIQLGEDPKCVFTVGSLCLDHIKRTKLLARVALEKKLNFRFNQRNLLVTFHPITLEKGTSRQQFQELLNTLDELKNTNIIFTKANADMEGRIINTLMEGYVRKNRHKVISFASMGPLLYLSTMQYVDAVIGNSSSGIMEAPSFKIGTINIGDRQKGRIMAPSIICCHPIQTEIRKAIKKLYSKNFQKILSRVKNPYGDGKTAKRIVDVLKNYDLRNILKKKFYDLPF